MRRIPLSVLLAGGLILLLLGACSPRRDVVPGDSVPQRYRIHASALYSPADFADYAYHEIPESWGKSYTPAMKALNLLVRQRNKYLSKVMSVKAGVADAPWGYRKYVLHYASIDALGRPLTLSEVVVVPVGIGWDFRPEKVFLSSHITLFADTQRPTGPHPDFLTGMASAGAVFICPDLQGYGVSADRIHPFLCHPVLARQTLDGVFAALDMLEDEGIVLQEHFKFYNGGYSEGGSIALAVHRLIENGCSREQRERLHLSRSYCYSGAYSPLETFHWYVGQEQVYYVCALPFIVDAMTASFPHLMRGIRTQDYFSRKFLDAGILEMVRSKQYGQDQIMDRIREEVGVRMDELLSQAALNPASPQVKALERALAACELTSGWAPESPVYLCHARADDYVPFVNALLALDGLGEGNVHFDELPDLYPSPHVGAALVFFFEMLLSGME